MEGRAQAKVRALALHAFRPWGSSEPLPASTLPPAAALLHSLTIPWPSIHPLTIHWPPPSIHWPSTHQGARAERPGNHDV